MPNFVIQHEFDFEPTYIVNKDDEDQYIKLDVNIPWKNRLTAAEKIAKILNELE
jgi:hypothetical protein